MQQISIILDPPEPVTLTGDLARDVTARYIPRVLASGWPVVELTVNDGAQTFTLLLTARNLCNIAGAVRGRMARDGLAGGTINPPLAFAKDPAARAIHFAFEMPLQEWTYSAEEAGKLWRALKAICQTL
jgi:hypothetical protein